MIHATNQEETDPTATDAERVEWEHQDYWTDREHLDPDRIAAAIDHARAEQQEKGA